MKTIQTKIADFLETDRWEIEKIQNEDLEWWADEIWKLRSIWSPQGSKAHITFLVDPQCDISKRKKGIEIWGVGNSKDYPASREHAESNGTIPLRSVNKNGLEKFSNMLDQLRELK